MISVAKTAAKKVGALVRSMKFLSPEVSLQIYHIVMSGLMRLAATRNC